MVSLTDLEFTVVFTIIAVCVKKIASFPPKCIGDSVLSIPNQTMKKNVSNLFLFISQKAKKEEYKAIGEKKQQCGVQLVK